MIQKRPSLAENSVWWNLNSYLKTWTKDEQVHLACCLHRATSPSLLSRGGGVSVCGRGLYAERFLQVLDQHMLPPTGVFFRQGFAYFSNTMLKHESITAAWHHSTQCADPCAVQFHQLQTSGAPWNHKNTTRPELISVSPPWLHSERSLYLNTWQNHLVMFSDPC